MSSAFAVDEVTFCRYLPSALMPMMVCWEGGKVCFDGVSEGGCLEDVIEDSLLVDG